MSQQSSLPTDFGRRMTEAQFAERFDVLHRQLFSSTEFEFDAVTTHVYAPPKGMYQIDHSLIQDGQNWHLFYVTGDMKLTEAWVKCRAAGDWEGANQVCLEPGNGHAVGKSLFDLKFKSNAFFPPQGRFDLGSRGVCSVFRHAGRYGMLYDVRGEDFIGMSLAWSDDLDHWELQAGNPVLGPPAWAKKGATCKDPHVMKIDGVYLIYYITLDAEGYCAVALTTTTDWKAFSDEGCVMRVPVALRGTMGTESPAVIERDGLWHLFVTYGPGLWHAVSATPMKFAAGLYYVGPFHATEIVQDQGDWWLTTDRKEESRRQNRAAGRLAFRGTYEDEKAVEEGLYLSRIRWCGDQPVLEKPTCTTSEAFP